MEGDATPRGCRRGLSVSRLSEPVLPLVREPYSERRSPIVHEAEKPLPLLEHGVARLPWLEGLERLDDERRRPLRSILHVPRAKPSTRVELAERQDEIRHGVRPSPSLASAE